jgi:nitrate reductase gamma subunit
MHAWLEWARGPVFIFCFSFMVLGLVRHVALTLWETTRIMRRAGDKSLPLAAIGRATLGWLFPVRAIVHEAWFTVTSVLFHVAVIIVPVFLAGHVALWARGTGLRWPAIPNDVADVLTILAVVTAVGLAVQRLTARATRAITKPSDHLLLLALALPFVTGFLVMHPSVNPFTYDSVLFLHVMSGNLVFVLLPTTKLTHAVLLPGTQLITEVGWHWPADAGSRVGAALGKGTEPV